MSLEGRVALVTGGDRGIGKGTALALADAGADVAIVYLRNEEAAKETIRELEAMGTTAAMLQADVTDYDAVKAAVNKAVEAFGKIDILVNNAGIGGLASSVFDMDVEEMRRVVATHAFGSFYFTQAVLPSMRQQPRGDIIFISSGYAATSGPNYSPYCMGKRAMEALAETVAIEERRNRIRVNIIRPGVVETDMGRFFVRESRGIENIKDMYASSPFGRVCQPSDIGNLVAFLVSEKGEYISAATIKVSGG